MKGLTTLFLASVVARTSAAPTNITACAALPPVTSSCTTTILTVTATSAPAPAQTQGPPPPPLLPPQASSPAPAAPANNNNGTAEASGSNVQKFTGSLGGPPPPVIFSEGADRPFSVNGDTFVGESAAVGRSCDVQHNACANAANSGSLSGGVGQCDQQNTACHAANNLNKRATTAAASPLSLGSCANADILFGTGLDGRGYTAAFVAANQQDFNHGSALNIAVIAGFVCQRLGSPCNAPADSQAACAQASSAAVAAPQDQRAADAWNAIMGGNGRDLPAPPPPPPAAITPAPSLAAMPSPAVQLLTFSSCS